ncbi:hypothetical protein OIU85_028106 [Salix viminalis]|uniref:Uncharacterized protein n=1 Tax=Salix viminalis TaxID=40686 RepID=A0A9Q0QJR4_SALVM|nr:hypothetical protein OIU85_028106 [Salix viminalis]
MGQIWAVAVEERSWGCCDGWPEAPRRGRVAGGAEDSGADCGYGFSGDGFLDGGCGGREEKGRLVRMGSCHGGRRGREEGKREKPE